MKGILFFLGSSGGSKFLPLLFGTAVSAIYGHAHYALLVQILTQSNFLTTVATASYVQLILSQHSQPGGHSYHLKSVVFAVLVSVVGGLWASHSMSSHGLEHEAWIVGSVVALYSSGNAVLLTVVSQLNAEFNNAGAGRLIFLTLLGPYLAAFVCLALGLPYYVTFSVIGILFLLMALGFYLRHNRGDFVATLKGGWVRTLVGAVPVSREHLLTMTFTGMIYYAHSLIVAKVNQSNSAEESAAFALGYQLFAMGLFIPNMLGNVVVPRLRRNAQTVNMSKLIPLYAAIGGAWVLGVYCTSPIILRIYHLNPDALNAKAILILQAAVVFGSLNALLNQKLMADRDLMSLAGLSVLYFVCAVLWARASHFEIEAAAQGLVLGYAMVLVGFGVLQSWRRARRLAMES